MTAMHSDLLPRLWITGATGFIGGHLCDLAAQRGWAVQASARRPANLRLRAGVRALGHSEALAGALEPLDVVIHTAARAHQLRDQAADPQREFREANVELSLAVAAAAVAAGARRLVYLSSIGVNGNATSGTPFTESDPPSPVEPYAASKLEAEHALRNYCIRAGLELVIVRPPLVYGRGAPGNFSRLLKLAHSGLPLPLGAINNRRSFVSVGNLCDFLLLAACHPAAAGELFLVADGSDISTARLLRLLAEGAGVPVRVWRFPPALLRFGCALLGQRQAYEKLCGSLQVNNDKARRLLGWVVPADLEPSLIAWAASEAKQSR